MGSCCSTRSTSTDCKGKCTSNPSEIGSIRLSHVQIQTVNLKAFIYGLDDTNTYNMCFVDPKLVQVFLGLESIEHASRPNLEVFYNGRRFKKSTKVWVIEGVIKLK